MDDRVDTDPVGVIKDVRRRRAALSSSDTLEAAELYAINADAANLLDDDANARVAVSEGRKLLPLITNDQIRQALALRFDLIAADSPANNEEMRAGVDRLNELERTLPGTSLERACLLMVRSRLNTQLLRDEAATSDGIAAYRLASSIPSPPARADAAYQLGLTYLRAGLFEDALQMADEAAAYNRTTGKLARLSNALYIKADTLEQMHDYEGGLAAISEARAINFQLAQLVDVAFDDQKLCNLFIEVNRLSEAKSTCLDAQRALSAADRGDVVAAIEVSLARVDLLQNEPRATIDRLDRALASGVERIPAKTLPKIYRLRSEALLRVGRVRDAIGDLRTASRLDDAASSARRGLAAARIKEQALAELAREQAVALEMQVRQQRQEAADQRRSHRLELALAATLGLFGISLAVLMWNRARRERALRDAAEKLETQARILSTLEEGVMLISDSGHIKYANPALLRLLRRSLDQVLGRPVGEVGISFDAIANRPSQQAGSGAHNGLELRLDADHGKAIVVLLTQSQVTLHDQTLRVCVLQDVTELRDLERKFLSTASTERSELSSEVHEGLAQELAGLALMLDGVTGKGPSDRSQIESITRHIRETIERARNLAKELSPLQVAGGSLAAALSQLGREIFSVQKIEVQFITSISDLRMNAVHADQIYRLTQDCLHLTASTTDCKNITCRLETSADLLLLTVFGDGVNDPADEAKDHQSWATIAYLTRVMGGTSQIERRPKEGPYIRVVIPVSASASERATCGSA